MQARHSPYHNPPLGILFKLASVVLLSGMAACVKSLGSAVPVGETIFVRGVISVPMLVWLAWRMNSLLRKTLSATAA